jgi:hypothetical protein
MAEMPTIYTTQQYVTLNFVTESTIPADGNWRWWANVVITLFRDA